MSAIDLRQDHAGEEGREGRDGASSSGAASQGVCGVCPLRAAEELHKLLGEERLAGASLMIFANKQDIPGALPAEEIEAALQLGDLNGRQWRVQPCSAVEVRGAQLVSLGGVCFGSAGDGGGGSFALPPGAGGMVVVTLTPANCAGSLQGTGLAEGVDWMVSEVASRLFLLAS
eukprot:COSAG01_NODE_3800_length_5685_cov_4.802542_8_plen_173_part_00